MRISDWSSDVCSSDLAQPAYTLFPFPCERIAMKTQIIAARTGKVLFTAIASVLLAGSAIAGPSPQAGSFNVTANVVASCKVTSTTDIARSEEHTSELQSLMRISYAVFCFKKKKTT